MEISPLVLGGSFRHSKRVLPLLTTAADEDLYLRFPPHQTIVKTSSMHLIISSPNEDDDEPSFFFFLSAHKHHQSHFVGTCDVFKAEEIVLVYVSSLAAQLSTHFSLSQVLIVLSYRCRDVHYVLPNWL